MARSSSSERDQGVGGRIMGQMPRGQEVAAAEVGPAVRQTCQTACQRPCAVRPQDRAPRQCRHFQGHISVGVAVQLQKEGNPGAAIALPAEPGGEGGHGMPLRGKRQHRKHVCSLVLCCSWTLLPQNVQ